MDQSSGTVARIVGAIDALNEGLGKSFAWLVIPLMVALAYEVVMRYGFDAPTTWAYDTSYMLYGAHFMLGAAFTLGRKGHIRTDFFYEKWSVRRQGTVDAICYLFLFFPGLFFFLLAAWDAAYHSWTIAERSEASAWRPIIYPFKMVMPVTAALLLLQGVAEFLKSLHAARTGRPWP